MITSSKKVCPDEVDEPNLTWLIQEFVHIQQHPELTPHNIHSLPLFYDKITIYSSIVVSFYTPSDLCGIGGITCECIHRVNR